MTRGEAICLDRACEDVIETLFEHSKHGVVIGRYLPVSQSAVVQACIDLYDYDMHKFGTAVLPETVLVELLTNPKWHLTITKDN